MSPLTQPSIQELIDSALEKQQKKLDTQIESMEKKMETLQLQSEDFKTESIHLIVNSLIEKEPFVTQVKFAKFENDIKLSLQSLPTLQDIKLLLHSAPVPQSPIRKYRRLEEQQSPDAMDNPMEYFDTTSDIHPPPDHRPQIE